MTIAQIFEEEYRKAEKGSLIFASDFADYNQDYIGDLLARYSKDGRLERLANGVYLKTTITKFGPVYPTPAKIAEAIASGLPGIPQQHKGKYKTEQQRSQI